MIDPFRRDDPAIKAWLQSMLDDKDKLTEELGKAMPDMMVVDAEWWQMIIGKHLEPK